MDADQPTTAAPITARCPVCHRRQRVLSYKWGFRFVDHLSGSKVCSGSRTEAGIS